MAIRFLLNGREQQFDEVEPSATALDLLRYRLRRTGTKEGCAEGDCGACTILLGDLVDGERVAWRAVNACILFAPMLAGRAVLTIEGVGRDGAPHPVQREMVARHGSQCGFCTPGIVMSLVGRAMGAEGTRGVSVGDVLSGNLCRCTGYGPILAAGEAVGAAAVDDAATVQALQAMQDELPDLLSDGNRRAFLPRTADALADLLQAHPDARIIAGASDVGLWVTKKLVDIPVAIFIDRIAELQQIVEGPQHVTMGAGVRYAQAWPVLAALHPDLGELVRRIAGTQIRNMGTIGGNIANGSPIGDMPPALIALGASIVLRRGSERRTIALEDFFIAYGRQDRQAGEFIESILIPRLPNDMIFRVMKLSKRFDSDISALCGAFALRISEGVVREARIAFGGMAGTPRRAYACEQVLNGSPWDEETVERACATLAEDYQPLTDVRGSAEYRLQAAGNFLRRMWLEPQVDGAPTSLHDPALIDG